MMFGNGFNGNGFSGIGNCFGLAGGYMHGGFLILTVLLMATAALLGTWFVMKRNQQNRTDSAVLETLKMKLISGEITEEEYLSKKNILK